MDSIFDNRNREVTVSQNEDGTYTFSLDGLAINPLSTVYAIAQRKALETINAYKTQAEIDEELAQQQEQENPESEGN